MAITGRPFGRGPRNRNAKDYDWTTVEDIPWTGPSRDLPSRRRQRWNVEARAWWEAVRQMPHCRFGPDQTGGLGSRPSAWKGVLRGEWNRPAELRLRSAKLGLTHENRLKLRIRYVEPLDEAAMPAADPAVVTRLDDRRKRLSGAPSCFNRAVVGWDVRSTHHGGVLAAAGSLR